MDPLNLNQPARDTRAVSIAKHCTPAPVHTYTPLLFLIAPNARAKGGYRRLLNSPRGMRHDACLCAPVVLLRLLTTLGLLRTTSLVPAMAVYLAAPCRSRPPFLLSVRPCAQAAPAVFHALCCLVLIHVIHPWQQRPVFQVPKIEPIRNCRLSTMIALPMAQPLSIISARSLLTFLQVRGRWVGARPGIVSLQSRTAAPTH